MHGRKCPAPRGPAHRPGGLYRLRMIGLKAFRSLAIRSPDGWMAHDRAERRPPGGDGGCGARMMVESSRVGRARPIGGTMRSAGHRGSAANGSTGMSMSMTSMRKSGRDRIDLRSGSPLRIQMKLE